jgi:hypothetical protein
VTLSGKSEKTLFAQHYKDETLLQYVDNLNVVYVALTRAKECMEIISAMPEEVGEPFKDFSQILYWYALKHGEKLGFRQEDQSFIYGEIPQKKKDDKSDGIKSLRADFCSWPLGSRLRFNTDSSDFFNDEGLAGVAASARIKGIVLHDILAQVYVKADLDAAVQRAVVAGTISSGESEEVKKLLRSRIDAVDEQGWFPDDPSCVINEVEVIDADGAKFRPDRVVKTGNSVKIIDYKFGAHYSDYEEKLHEYARLWREMGYDVLSVSLWYVPTGEIVRVE